MIASAYQNICLAGKWGESWS